jgi:phosphoglycerol transferase
VSQPTGQTPERAPVRRRWTPVPAVVPLLGAAFATGVAIVQWRLWRGGLGTPITYEADATLYHSLTKTIIDQGWYFTDPHLGAPFERILYDSQRPYEGNLNFLAIRVLAWISHSPFVVNNLFVLLTFPAVFAAAWFAFRRLRFSQWIAGTVAVVFTLSPYHFFRRDFHPLLSNYVAVPLACLLLYELVARGAADDGVPHDPTWGRLRRVLVSRWFWVPVLIGLSGGYYTFFFACLAILVGIGLTIRSRDLRRLVRPLVCVALAVGVLLAGNLPGFVYQWRHGTNTQPVDRQLGENDIYGLQIAYLVLPIDNHRISAFADFKDELTGSVSPLRDPEKQSLGLVAAVGLLVSLGSLVLTRAGSGTECHWSSLRRRSGALDLAAILLGTVGGLSTLIGLFGFVDVRAYNRLSIFIAFFSLVGLAALAESLIARRRLLRWPAAVAAALVVVCAFAAFDQTAIVPTRRAAVEAAVTSDRDFVHEIDRRLGGTGQVFELPLLRTADEKITGLPPTTGSANPGEFFTHELAKPALFTDSLRWSWGATKGRPEDLTPSYVGRPVDSLLSDLDALGFDGVYIDRRGFADQGVEIEARLESLLGEAPLVSKDGTKSFFDLRPYRRSHPAPTQQDREAARHPVELDWGDGFGDLEGNGRFYPQLAGVASRRTAADGATLVVSNTTRRARHLSLHADAELTGSAAGTLEVRWGRDRQRFAIPGSPTPIVIEADLPPGTTRVTFHATEDPVPGATSGRPTGFVLDGAWYEAPFAPGA